MNTPGGDTESRHFQTMRNTVESIYSRKRLVLFILISFFGLGVLWHALPAVFPVMMMITPYVLFVFGMVIFLPAFLEDGRRLLLWACLTYLLTFAIEAAGVATGRIFGVYSYGEALGAKLLGVPLLIGFNWTIVVLGIASFFSRFIKNRFLVIVLVALGGVLFDWVMEPVAIALDYWNWQNAVIPLRNYLAWFAIGFAAATGYALLDIKLKTIYPSVYVLIQLLFFAALRFFVI